MLEGSHVLFSICVSLVANEVRKLSGESTQAVDHIKSFLLEIQNSTSDIRQVVEGNLTKINEGLELTTSSRTAFLVISEGIQKSVDHITEHRQISGILIRN
ncbi:methyl-accepting chemotaxis protein [Tepidibacillus marianensis]|uniref:methyl-accepting chemotaxis protein n=1 Tax=Tepidibacillus marianensis TaxID=3131995 RepID=UPI0030CEAC2A